jgi:AraC-like DNA-binding protein
MSGTFYCSSEFSVPWALAIPDIKDSVMLHVVTGGRSVLQVEGLTDRTLEAGDLALVPHGKGHVLASGPGVVPSPLFEIYREQVSERYETLQLGGGGERTTMVCGLFRFDDPAAQLLVSLLPAAITVNTWASDQAEWIASTLRMISAEAAAMNPGGETVITRLADILVVHAIRHWLTGQNNEPCGWLRALQDRQIGSVLAKVHRQPHRRWTLEQLASEAAMSRSIFAQRFTRLVGEPAMHYVTRWQMAAARLRLAGRKETVAEVAHAFGYESEAAFNRAFKRHIGISPGVAKQA